MSSRNLNLFVEAGPNSCLVHFSIGQRSSFICQQHFFIFIYVTTSFAELLPTFYLYDGRPQICRRPRFQNQRKQELDGECGNRNQFKLNWKYTYFTFQKTVGALVWIDIFFFYNFITTESKQPNIPLQSMGNRILEVKVRNDWGQ